MESIKEISDKLACDSSYFNLSPTRLGDFWVSKHTLNRKTNYTSIPPTGIHLGAGVTEMSTHCETLVKCSYQGPVVTLLVIPEGQKKVFNTTVEAGLHLSCGLHISFSTLAREPKLGREIFANTKLHEASFNVLSSSTQLVNELCQNDTYLHDSISIHYATEAKALNLIALILREVNKPHFNYTPNHIEIKLNQAKQLIVEQYNKPLTIPYIATKIGMSPRTLTSHYKAYFGTTISHSLCQVRLNQASQLLQRGYSVSETAYMVGYSANHLSTKFSKIYGYPAIEHRNRCLPKFVATLPNNQ